MFFKIFIANLFVELFLCPFLSLFAYFMLNERFSKESTIELMVSCFYASAMGIPFTFPLTVPVFVVMVIVSCLLYKFSVGIGVKTVVFCTMGILIGWVFGGLIKIAFIASFIGFLGGICLAVAHAKYINHRPDKTIATDE